MRLLMELGFSQEIIDICLIILIIIMGIVMFIRYKEIGTNKSMDRNVSNFILARPWITIIVYVTTVLFMFFMDSDHRLTLPLILFTILIGISLYFEYKKRGGNNV